MTKTCGAEPNCEDCDCQHFAYWKEGRAVMIQCETCKAYLYAKSQYHAQNWANKHAGETR